MKYDKENIKKFICLLCFKRFCEIKNLKEHMLIHINKYREEYL